jgi:GTP cyclohydrolase II
MDLYAFARDSRTREDPEILALVNGYRQDADHVAVVRVHSACFTGDVLGSGKCDCGPQLRTSLDLIARSPWGILIYLARQEGRGIGLVRKIQAYALQDEGLDTVAANQVLHVAVDAREYSVAAAALRYLDAVRIWLLTNSPDKVEGLRTSGIEVVGVQRMPSYRGTFSSAYIRDKERMFGHRFVDHT